MILYVTLHARKVTTEERKQLETTRLTLSYKATVVLRWYVSGPTVMVVSIVILNEAKHKMFKSVVFILRQTRVLVYLLFATSTKCCSLFSTCFPRCLSLPTLAADKQRHAWPRPLRNHIARISLRPGGNKNGISAVFRSSFHFRQNVLGK